MKSKLMVPILATITAVSFSAFAYAGTSINETSHLIRINPVNHATSKKLSNPKKATKVLHASNVADKKVLNVPLPKKPRKDPIGHPVGHAPDLGKQASLANKHKQQNIVKHKKKKSFFGI